jgi:hypothetical protein
MIEACGYTQGHQNMKALLEPDTVCQIAGLGMVAVSSSDLTRVMQNMLLS